MRSDGTRIEELSGTSFLSSAFFFASSGGSRVSCYAVVEVMVGSSTIYKRCGKICSDFMRGQCLNRESYEVI